MPVDDSWIDRYLSRRFVGYRNPEDPGWVEDRDLAELVQGIIAEALRGMNAIPEQDRFWDGTNREPTLGKIEGYCAKLQGQNPGDDRPRWYRFALDFHQGSNDVGTGHLVPLVAKDLKLLRWLVPASRHAEDSGLSGAECLREALGRLKAEVPDLESRLQALSGDPEARLRGAAQAALAALRGADPFHPPSPR